MTKFKLYGYCCILALFLFPSFLFAQIALKLERSTATYQIGETAQFQLLAAQGGTVQYDFFYEASNTPISSGTLTAVGGSPLNIPFTGNEAGVVFCNVQLNNNVIKAAATFSPFDINALEAEPTDFDAFWQNAKNELAAIPIDAQITFLQNNTYSTTYRVNLANIGNKRVYGYLTVPNGSGPFPAVIKFPAFGTDPNIASIGEQVAEDSGVLFFSTNIHNVEPDQEDPNAYQPNDLNDPNQIYYKFAALAGVRIIDYLLTRPDFDQENIAVMGESQGGGLSMMVAGLDQRVDVLLNSNPTHCQNLGSKYGKANGFGFFLPSNAPSNQQQNVKYFDNVYFAKRFNGISWTFISYEDEICHAATTFAAFNQLNGPKILTHSVDLGHVHPAQFWTDHPAFFRKYLPTATPSNPFVGSESSWLINAGEQQNIPVGSMANLSATIEKEGSNNPNFQLKWSQVSGPGNVTFSNDQSYTTTANFSEEGTYILRFTGEDQELINNFSPQYFTLMDELIIEVGNCVDTDNDGYCVANDCDDMNPNVPATPGSSCDDGNSETENDKIQTDACTCLGTPIIQCTDNDNDGICQMDDCDDNNPSIPAAPNTICDDRDATTENDRIQSDGCTCSGDIVSGGDPNVCEVQITTGNGSITVSGMDEPNFRLQIFNQSWSELYYECFWANCENTKTINNLATGIYVVKVQSFNASWVGVCDFIEYPMVINDGGSCTDNDNDGICEGEDCDDANSNLPTTSGTTCDDGDATTENDVIQSDGCTCAGTPIVVCTDNDNDGICEGEDCDDANPNLPTTAGTLCDDGDTTTENDVIQSDGCTCAGTPINTGEPSCDNIQLDGNNGQLTISGLTAPIQIVRVRNSSWQQIYECVANCENPIILPNLSVGNYPVQLQMYTQNWSPICFMETMATVTNGTTSSRNSELSDLPKIGLYPNPASSEVLINLADFQGETIQLKIINQLGKTILNKNDFKAENGVERIDLQDFTNGLYFVQVQARGKRMIGAKLMVSRLY